VDVFRDGWKTLDDANSVLPLLPFRNQAMTAQYRERFCNSPVLFEMHNSGGTMPRPAAATSAFAICQRNSPSNKKKQTMAGRRIYGMALGYKSQMTQNLYTRSPLTSGLCRGAVTSFRVMLTAQ
jgi:hypothetical protein